MSVGERDHVVEGGEQAGENHDECDAPVSLLGKRVRGLDKGIDGGAGALVCLLGSGAEGGDGDSRCAKNDELDDAAAIEQVKGKLQEDACGIGCSRSGGEFEVVLERQRKGVMCRGAQQTESKECHTPQNLERKRLCGELNLGQAHNGDGDSGVGGRLGLTLAPGEAERRRVSDKADDAGAQNKALCEHNTLGTGE